MFINLIIESIFVKFNNYIMNFEQALQYYQYKVDYYRGVDGWRAQDDINNAHKKLIEIAGDDVELKRQIPRRSIVKSDGMGGLFGALSLLKKH